MKLWLLLLAFYLSVVNVYGAEAETEEVEVITEEETDLVTRDLFDDLQLEELDDVVHDMLQSSELSFSDMVWKMLSGEVELDTELLFEMIEKIFFRELLNQKEILLQLLLLILVAAVLFNLSYLFENGQMTNMTFYIIYLIAFVILMQSFRGLLGQVEGVLDMSASFMKILTPAYFLAITAANGSMTASAYYQVVLFAITLIQDVLLQFGIPCIQIYVVIGIVNYLSQEDFLSKMAELLKTIVVWLTKTVTTLIVGMQVIQKMVAPAVDMVKRGFMGKTASAIPGIGNLLDSVTEMTIGCAVLVRNCLGAAALVVLIIFGLGPIIQIGISTLLYRLIAAVIQPVSEKRLVQAITVMAEGCGILLRVLVTAEILFLLTIAIVATGGVQ